MAEKAIDSPLGIYIHIPFCVQKCKYCDFTSFANQCSETKSQYVEALKKDISLAAQHLKNKTVDSIYFGGGTPTCLSPDDISDVIKTVFDSYNVSRDTEITAECNPATISKDGLRQLHSSGFNRLSIGLQSVHNKELQALGRIHTFEDFLQTYDNAAGAGFNNVSLDLMYGIPHQTVESFQRTLETVASLEPQHISAYGLIIEPGTEFFAKRDSLPLPDEEAEYEMYKMADATLIKLGYEHYEISNYALNGKRSKHNMKYWQLDDYVGFGISAHSLINGKRYYITSKIPDYIDHFLFNDKTEHCFIEEIPDDLTLCEEYVMMRLRLTDGLLVDDMIKRFPNAPLDKYLNRMSKFIDSGHIINSKGKYFLSADGMYISNYILSDILDLE